MVVFNGRVTVKVHLGTRGPRWIYDTFREGRRGGGPTRSLSNCDRVYRREVDSPLLNFPPITNLKCCSHGHLRPPVPLPALTAKQRPRAPCSQTRTGTVLWTDWLSRSVRSSSRLSSHCPAGQSVGAPVTCR